VIKLNKISISDLMLIIDQINIIDIRSIQSYNNNHIPNARNIPLEKLITQPEQYLNKMEKYYMHFIVKKDYLAKMFAPYYLILAIM